MMELATLGNDAGVDLWHYRSPSGDSIRGAVDFLLPYALGQKKWNYSQISGFNGDALEHPLERAAAEFHDPQYAAAAKHLESQSPDLETVLLRLSD